MSAGPDPTNSDVGAAPAVEQPFVPAPLCGARCPLLWELGGICQCIEPAGHVERQDGTFGADHMCSCGTWFGDEVARGA